jgi:3-oxoacyl-[acyl-carrier-protein] synthase-3
MTNFGESKSMNGIKICGMGKCLPELSVDNNSFAEIMDTNDEWIKTRTGISRRSFSSGEAVWEMASHSAHDAIKNAGIEASQIGLIIGVTITGDFVTPSLSCMVQREIGIHNAAAFDVNAACSGFIYGLDTARRFLQTDDSLEYVLVTGSEKLSSIVDFTDRASCILFGDGSASAVVTRADSCYGVSLGADGNGASALYSRHLYKNHPFGEINAEWEKQFPGDNITLYQDGHEVYKFAVKALPAAAETALSAANLTTDDIDWFIPHQANLRIIQTAAKTMGVSLDRFIINIENHGNTSGVTIPLALCEAIDDGVIKRGDKLCLIGFGAGLTYGSIVMEY